MVASPEVSIDHSCVDHSCIYYIDHQHESSPLFQLLYYKSINNLRYIFLFSKRIPFNKKEDKLVMIPADNKGKRLKLFTKSKSKSLLSSYNRQNTHIKLLDKKCPKFRLHTMDEKKTIIITVLTVTHRY